MSSRHTPHFKRDMGAHTASRGRVHDRDHLALIRQLPCCVCWRHAPSEAAHVRLSDAELGVVLAGGACKPDDALALPLCAKHHREGGEAEHIIGTRAFWKRHDIDPLRLALRLSAVAAKEDVVQRKLAAMLNVLMRLHFMGERLA